MFALSDEVNVTRTNSRGAERLEQVLRVQAECDILATGEVRIHRTSHARACSLPEASMVTDSASNVNRSGAERSSTSATRRTASMSSPVLATA